MQRYLIRRLAFGAVAIWGALTIVFALTVLTGDPAILIMPEGTPEQLRELRHVLGLDRPLVVQYADYILRAVQGDFGRSYTNQASALRSVWERIGPTSQLVFAATVVTVVASMPLGIAAALMRGRWADRLISFAVLFGQSMPIFWTGIILILILSIQLHWLPTSGYGTLSHLIMPAMTLGVFAAAELTRVTRASMLETLAADYIRTAYAKGLMKRVVILKHALRNALIPVLTLVAFRFAEIIAGSVVIEAVFGWPGLGSLILFGVQRRDLPLVQAGIFVVAVVVVVVNIFVDTLYAIVDPRIRYG